MSVTRQATRMTRHIGIVACSAEGAALCYRTICAEGAQLFGDYMHPEISMHTRPFGEYTKCFDLGDWNAVAELMLESANKLASIGADFLICPDNTIHRALSLIESRSPIPWLNIAEIVAAAAAAGGFQRVGVLGTRWLIESELYVDKLGARGIGCVRPTPVEREEIHRIIMEELVNGISGAEAITYLGTVIERMKDGGCDAIVLGCTEIPLIISDANSPLPTLDSTRLLARAALHRSVAKTPVAGA